MPYLAAGVIQTGGATLIGQGRGAFAYPDSVNDLLQNGKMCESKCCVACSACTQIMRDGKKTGCVVRDSKIYGPSYREARRYAIDHLQNEAKRCRECHYPTCKDGCPARVDIPDFLKAFADGKFKDAYMILRKSNRLPEMCGHVCPSEEQCELNCVESIFKGKAVPIRDIQLAACGIARLNGWLGAELPNTKTNKKIAIVGAGPAGCAAAIRLLEYGHHVTLFEAASAIGGTPDSIIPIQRYASSADEISEILKPAAQEKQIEIKLNTKLGTDVKLNDLQKQFDVVILAVGTMQGQSLTKTTAAGVVDALQFLRDVKSGKIKHIPQSVYVLGGGNTAMDAAVTAKQLGARDVSVIYRRSFQEMPAWKREREHAVEVGVNFHILMQPKEYIVDHQNKLTGIKVVRTELGEPDASGRRTPKEIEGTETVLQTNFVIEAIGQSVADDIKKALPGIEFTKRGTVLTQKGSHKTTLSNVWAVGDLINGGATAVQGVYEGTIAAEEIHKELKGEK